MKKIIRSILVKLSRAIYLVIPDEFKSGHNLKFILRENSLQETYNHFKEYFEKCLLFDNGLKIREYAIKSSLLNDDNKEYYYLEFGVHKGESTNYFSKFVNKLYCFDSFEGLKEDWIGTDLTKGHFNLNKKIPKLNSNVEPIVGWVEETLDDFLKKKNPRVNFVHLDMDTYTSTKFALEKLKPYFVKNAIIIFDQFYNYHGWKNGEYKALKEVFDKDEYSYKAFFLQGKRCVIQLK